MLIPFWSKIVLFYIPTRPKSIPKCFKIKSQTYPKRSKADESMGVYKNTPKIQINVTSANPIGSHFGFKGGWPALLDSAHRNPGAHNPDLGKLARFPITLSFPDREVMTDPVTETPVMSTPVQETPVTRQGVAQLLGTDRLTQFAMAVTLLLLFTSSKFVSGE